MKNSNESFVAFFSYARLNDEHDRGKLTLLRKLLQSEVWVQTGKPFQIFQDQENIEWGQNWKNRIKGVLETCSSLIAIVTPSYLVSQSCRFEFEYFIKQEFQLKRKLILPILYIDTPGLRDTNDKIAVEISKRQWIDWGDLRFASPTSAKMTKKLELLARHIRDLTIDEAIPINTSSKVASEFPPDSVVRRSTREEVTQSSSYELANYLSPTPFSIWNDRPENQRKFFLITLILRSTGDSDRDKRRIKTLYGTLISFHGQDRFSFQLFEKGTGYLIDFPHDTTRVSPELLDRLKRLIGEENWRVEEITFQ